MPQHNCAHTFYRTNNLTLKQKREICLKAKDVCFSWWVDKLDCAVSMSRQKIDMEFDEILKKLTSRSSFVIINRIEQNKQYFEIGFRTDEDQKIGKFGYLVEYFLWILVDPLKASFLKKYPVY